MFRSACKVLGFVLAFSLPQMAKAVSGKHFNNVIYVIFENTDYVDALDQPYMGQLAKQGATFSNLVALVHPSQANYIALTSGSENGVVGDGKYNVNANNIVDLLEKKGLTWKVYAEGWPGGCFTGGSSGAYYRKHNPFISYVNIQKNAERCAKIVEASEFDADAKSGKLPNYAFFIPDSDNDGHDTGVAYADSWYSKRFGPYISDSAFMAGKVVVSTFDEDSGSDRNQIYTSIVGPSVKPGTYSDKLDTYSLLRLVEDNWDLGTISTGDAGAAPIPEIWK